MVQTCSRTESSVSGKVGPLNPGQWSSVIKSIYCYLAHLNQDIFKITQFFYI